jgi:hypothetical protein
MQIYMQFLQGDVFIMLKLSLEISKTRFVLYNAFSFKLLTRFEILMHISILYIQCIMIR